MRKGCLLWIIGAILLICLQPAYGVPQQCEADLLGTAISYHQFENASGIRYDSYSTHNLTIVGETNLSSPVGNAVELKEAEADYFMQTDPAYWRFNNSQNNSFIVLAASPVDYLGTGSPICQNGASTTRWFWYNDYNANGDRTTALRVAGTDKTFANSMSTNWYTFFISYNTVGNNWSLDMNGTYMGSQSIASGGGGIGNLTGFGKCAGGADAKMDISELLVLTIPLTTANKTCILNAFAEGRHLQAPVVETDIIAVTLNSPLNNTVTSNSSIIINFTYIDTLGYNATCNVSSGSSVITSIASVQNASTKQYVWSNFTYGTKSVSAFCYNNTVNGTSNSSAVQINKISGILKMSLFTGGIMESWLTPNNTISNFNITSLDREYPMLLFGTSTMAGLIVEPLEVANVTFNRQVPADITTVNLFNELLNVSYNISSNIVLDSVSLSYKTNSSSSDARYYENGTAFTGWASKQPSGNISGVFDWVVDNNDVYPATYNFNEKLMESYAKSDYDLDLNGEFVKIKILNISHDSNYTFLEINAHNQSGLSGTLRIYYCNASYASGNVLLLSSPCVEFYALANTQPYNHTHGANSQHWIIPFSFNLTSHRIGSVYVNNGTGYFLLRGRFLNGWNIKYISNVSRTDTIQTTQNSGTSWSNLSGTVDAHMHQYDGSEYFRYFACANSTENSQNCTGERSDLLEIGGLPPTAPYVFSPFNDTVYRFNVSINYTASFSPNNYEIVFYNISLLDENTTFVKTIISNNSGNLNYTWDRTGTNGGNYTIRVTACDSQGLCSAGDSEIFTLNSGPVVTQDIENMSLFHHESVSVQWNVTESSNDTLTYSITCPGYLNITINQTGRINVTPESVSQNGTKSCIAIVKDSEFTTYDYFSLYINNHPPRTIQNLSGRITMNHTQSFGIQWNVTDDDSDVLSFGDNCSFVSLNSTGYASISPSVSDTGNHTCYVNSTDSLEIASSMFNITVLDIAPAFNSSSQIPSFNLRIGHYNDTFNVSGSFYDPDGDAMTYNCTSNDNRLVFEPLGSGMLNVSSSLGWVGNATANCTANDSIYINTSNNFNVYYELNYSIDADVELCPAIKTIHWKPPTHYNLWKNLSPDRQEYENCLFSVTNNYPGKFMTYTMSLNHTDPGYALKCDDDCTPSGASEINSSEIGIRSAVPYGETFYICCWMDYNNPGSVFASDIYVDGWW